MTRLVKRLYPHAQEHELRRQVRTIFFALVCGAVVALLLAGFIYWMYNSDRFFR